MMAEQQAHAMSQLDRIILPPSPRQSVSEGSVISTAPRATLLDRILFATVLLWTFLATCFPMYDTDFWWHLRTGEWILETHSIPGIDLYTFTDIDRPWIDLHWGFQILITVLYHLGGVPLVTLCKAGITSAAVAVAWQAGGISQPAWKKAVVWVLPIVCITGRANERPEMLSLLFLAVWLWIATHSDHRPGWIWFLPLLQLVWVNCHALFVLGLVVGFSYAVDAVARDLAQGRFGLAPRTTGPDFRMIWIVGGLVALACFVNPYFEEGALFPLTLYRKFSTEKEFYSVNIREFQPPINFIRRMGLASFTNIYLLSELGSWLMAASSFVVLALVRRRWSLFRLLLFAGFSHLAWQASRNTNIFALISGFVACENFSDFRRLSPLKSQALPVSSHTRRTVGMIALMSVLCILVVTGVWNQIGERNKPFRLGEAPNWFIHDAARFAGQPGFPEWAFVAHNGQAEVYIYHNGPQRKVFMDARLEVCTQQTFQAFNGILQKMSDFDPSWTAPFRERIMPVVILDSRSSRPAINGMLNNPGWRLVFADPSAAVFLDVETADKLKLPAVSPNPLMYPDGPPKQKMQTKNEFKS